MKEKLLKVLKVLLKLLPMLIDLLNNAGDRVDSYIKHSKR